MISFQVMLERPNSGILKPTRLSAKDRGGMTMASIKPKKLPNPIYVRLPEDLVETIRGQALISERTLSSQIRWLLQNAVREEGKA